VNGFALGGVKADVVPRALTNFTSLALGGSLLNNGTEEVNGTDHFDAEDQTPAAPLPAALATQG